MQRFFFTFQSLHETFSFSSISSIPDSLQDLNQLERLYLQHNKLKVMPCLKNCQHLKEIYLGFNSIEELTDMDLDDMPNVKLLDLRENKIPVLPDEIINLQNLERLDISNNDLCKSTYHSCSDF